MKEHNAIKPTREVLYKFYVEDKHTLDECRKHFRAADETLHAWLNEYNIHVRTSTEQYYITHPAPFTKDELIEYYIEQNHNQHECAEYFNVTVPQFQKWMHKYKVVKSRELIGKLSTKNNIEWHKRKTVEEKQLTNSKISSTLKNKTAEEKAEIKRKIDATYEAMSDEEYQAIKDTWTSHLTTYMENETEEQQRSRIEAHRKSVAARTPEEQAVITLKSNANYDAHPGKREAANAKGKATWASRPVEVHEAAKQKRRFTWENKSEAELAEIQHKRNATKKKNNSFHTSQVEDEFYQFLVQHLGSADVIRQYRSEVYPFDCDFYISSLDLYIELNLTWTHNDHPFDETNTNDIQTLENMRKKAETSDYYKCAIETWTIRDVKKLKTAQLNKLNYKYVYNNEELLQLKEYIKSLGDIDASRSRNT